MILIPTLTIYSNIPFSSITFQKQNLGTNSKHNKLRKYKLDFFDRLAKDNFINFHKIQDFISIQACHRQNLKKTEREHTFTTPTQMEMGVLEICHVFADSTLFKQQICSVLKRVQVGEHLLVIFCGHHKWVVISKAMIISKKANGWNGNAPDIPEILILRHGIT